MSLRPLPREPDLARLCELASAGAEDAAAALAGMLGATVHRRLARAFVLGPDFPPAGRPDPAGRGAAGFPGADATGVFFELDGDLTGVAAVLFPDAGRDALVGRLLERQPGSDLDTALESAINELANILVSHLVSTVADRLSSRIIPSVPEFFDEAAGKALALRLLREARGRPVFGLECEIADAAGLRLCSLVLAPGA